jgi:internalin A
MTNDLEIIKELEKELNFELKNKKTNVRWSDKAYQTDKNHNVIGLALYNMKLEQISKIVFELKNLNSLYLEVNLITEIPSEIGQLKNLTELGLVSNQLTELPAEITQLKNLCQLGLGNNKLRKLPAKITQLKKLDCLGLGLNQFSRFPAEITQLKNLTGMSLNSNQLTKLPAEIGELKKLTGLDLGINHLIELPSEIGQLKDLTTLIFSYNGLTKLPAEIGQLKKIIRLDLGRNELTKLPAEITQLKNLTELSLKGNPLKSPPPEIIEKGIKAIFEYLEKLDKQEKRIKKGKEITEDRIVNEAKLILVGQGDVGKTCLAERLIYDRFQAQSSTEGIDILKWRINPPIDEKQEIDLNVWDFGGQEIYHATHQFFLTKSSVYIVVWNARKSHDYEFIYYWLHIVEAFGEDSPIILVMSKSNERDDDLNMKDLKERFPQIIGSYKIDCEDGTGIDELKEVIAKVSWNLPQMNETWIISWLKTRRELERIRYEEKKDWIDYNTFLEICEKQGLSKPKTDILDGYLHDLGVIIHFHEPLALKDMVILDPEWATKAVYKILDFKPVRNRQGILLHNELDQIWDIKKYPINIHPRLLELMNKFELAYELPDKKSHLVAELLPSTEPEESIINWNDEDNLCFYYCYDFLPAGVITRFIVRVHENLEFKDEKQELHLCWREGAILQREKTRAFVKVRALDKIIEIKIYGQKKRELLAIIRNHFDQINEKIKKVKVRQEIPCNCKECAKSKNPHFYKYDLLQRYEQKGKEKIKCETSLEDVDVLGLIDNVTIPLVKENEYIKCKQLFFDKKEIPYHYGSKIIDPAKFYGRKNEKREILQFIKQAEQENYWHLSVVGDYRTGKSSLFKILEYEIERNLKSIAVYIELPSQEYFFQNILSSVGKAVFEKSNDKTLVRKFKQLISNAKSSKELENLGLEINIFGMLKIKSDTRSKEAWIFFKEALDALFKKLNEFGEFCSIVVIIDELSAISKWQNHSKILQEWRALIQSVNGYNFIVGSIHPLYQLTKDDWSPFFNIFKKIKLNGLEPKEAEELIIKPGKSVSLYFQQKMIDYIHILTGDHPYYIQIFCSEICKHLLKMGNAAKIDKDLIYTCIEDSIEELNDHFQSLLKSITFFQKKLLLDCSESDTNSCSIEFNSLSSEQRQEFRLLNNRGLIQKKGIEIKICGILAEWLNSYYSDISKLEDQEKDDKITFSQEQNQKIDVKIDIQTNLPAVQSDFEELKDELIKLNPEFKEKLNEIGDSLDDVNPNMDQEKFNKPLNKLGRFLQKSNDKNSDYYPLIQKSKKAIKFAQSTAKTYNKFAQWLALPQVPDPFLGK